jgi:hypothetical protein
VIALPASSYSRLRANCPPVIAAVPTTMPSTTRSSFEISPCWIEYWKKSTPAIARKMPPSTAAPRTPSQRSHSMRGRGAGAAGGIHFSGGIGGVTGAGRGATGLGA